jgi:hypothetical protein
MTAYVIGVDPGATTGVARLDLATRTVELLQCTPGLVLPVVRDLCVTGDVLVLAVERFVVGPRAARSSTPKAGAITRDLIGALQAEGEQLADRVVLRSASDVKPWFTPRRLAAAGLVHPGMPHALDAGRHAWFAAVHDCGIPDPLSARAGAR